jgi:hypothetical protein
VTRELTERPEAVVASEAEGRIRNYLANATLYNPTRSLRALSSQIAQEYEDRFLVELVQNAYDAQPPGSRDGVVHIRLDERPDKPVLYVANTGTPFTKANFAALTNVALSSKPAGEGIGNKGLGFRSVLRVCDSPEIYSADPEDLLGTEFDGYCFGFATEADIRALVPDGDAFERVLRDFSRYLLPVPAEAADPYLAELRGRGMVTVVRMPIADEAAAEVARREIGKLLSPRPPIALFLDRITDITVEHYRADGSQAHDVIDRASGGAAGPTESLDLRWVTTAGHRFLAASRVVQAAAVREVIASSIQAGQIDPAWSDWQADVEVSLAIEPESEVSSGSGALYTYLPMQVRSPFRGHLHAPFHTKMARLDLNESSIFNEFLLTEAAGVAVSAIRALVEGSLDLPLAVRHAAVVDLVCWEGARLPYLRKAMADSWGPLGTVALIPGEDGDGKGWFPAGKIKSWERPGASFLTADAIRHHSPLLASSLDPERRAAIRDFCRNALAVDLAPTDTTVAEWVERIAQTLPRKAETWNGFLDEVAEEFTTHRRDTSKLQGRSFLLDQRGRVLRAGPWHVPAPAGSGPPVFFPPQQGGPARDLHVDGPDEDSLTEVPKGLLRAVAYLHPDILLSRRVGSTSERTAAADLLRSANLVERFELAAILDHVQRLLTGRVAEQTQRQALMWVYRQDRAARSPVSEVDLRRLGLRVPTTSGWKPAHSAYFSAAWGSESARTLDTLLRDAAHLSPTLTSVRDALILGPTKWPVRLHHIDAFRKFLVRCGVRDGLHPLQLRAARPPTFAGWSYTPERICRWFGLADERWLAHASESMPRLFAGPQTDYTGEGDLWFLPGSEAHDAFSPSVQAHFAAAVLETVGDWPAETWRHQYRRLAAHHRSRPDPHEWPSPVRSFIERASWLPMSDPNRRGEVYFVAPRDAWTFDETGGDQQAPRFARLVPVEHRRTLVTHPQSRARLAEAGLQVWNSHASAVPRLRELGRLVAGDVAPSATLPSLRRSAEVAWGEAVRSPSVRLPADLVLVVSRGSVLGTLAPDAESPCDVFIDDGASPLVAAVLAVRALPLLAARAEDGIAVAGVLAGVRGVRVHTTSALNAVVSLDSQVVEPGPAVGGPLLEQLGSWFERFLLTVLDQRPSQFVRVTDSVLHQAAARTRRIRVLTGGPIKLEVTGVPEGIGHSREAVHLDDAEAPLLIVDNRTMPWPSWSALEVIADDLARLIGHSHAAPEIRAAALHLDRSQQEWRRPSIGSMARALRVTEEAVEAFERELAGSVETLRDLIAPTVAVMGGIAAYERFVDGPAENLEEIRALLSELVGLGAAEELLRSAERAESLDDLRRRVGVTLGDLNDALLTIGMRPLSFRAEHQSFLQAYLSEHRGELSDALRVRHLEGFRGWARLDRYASARDFHGIKLDPAWLHDRETPSDRDIALAVELWKEQEGAVPDILEDLPDIDEVRESNARFLRNRLSSIAAAVHAWSRHNGVQASADWADTADIRKHLEASGCLDFEALTVDALIGWLAVLGLWPNGMPRTAELVALGLDPDDGDPRILQARIEAERRRERDTVTVQGERFDTSGDGLVDLLEVVKGAIGDDFLGSSARVASLSSLSAAAPQYAGGRGDGGSARQMHQSTPSNAVTAAIGLAGEQLAYEWLMRHYQETTPRSWVSANRVRGLGGESGDDTLGYDFVVHRRSGPLYFEVKATVTELYAFDIGESELRFARTARNDRYRILFIRGVFDNPQLLVLPNPMDPRFAQYYQQVNQGIRFRFATP